MVQFLYCFLWMQIIASFCTSGFTRTEIRPYCNINPRVTFLPDTHILARCPPSPLSRPRPTCKPQTNHHLQPVLEDNPARGCRCFLLTTTHHPRKSIPTHTLSRAVPKDHQKLGRYRMERREPRRWQGGSLACALEPSVQHVEKPGRERLAGEAGSVYKAFTDAPNLVMELQTVGVLNVFKILGDRSRGTPRLLSVHFLCSLERRTRVSMQLYKPLPV